MAVAEEGVISLCAESPATARVLVAGRESLFTAFAVVEGVTVTLHPGNCGLTGAEQTRRQLTGGDVTEQT